MPIRLFAAADPRGCPRFRTASLSRDQRIRCPVIGFCALNDVVSCGIPIMTSHDAHSAYCARSPWHRVKFVGKLLPSFCARSSAILFSNPSPASFEKANPGSAQTRKTFGSTSSIEPLRRFAPLRRPRSKEWQNQASAMRSAQIACVLLLVLVAETWPAPRRLPAAAYLHAFAAVRERSNRPTCTEININIVDIAHDVLLSRAPDDLVSRGRFWSAATTIPKYSW